ncbi:hypothetical protein A2U01_0070000, partial [Trifolium medium]|nr:hypothetical protein [Trifolium medium]
MGRMGRRGVVAGERCRGGDVGRYEN